MFDDIHSYGGLDVVVGGRDTILRRARPNDGRYISI